jgi:Peptidase family M28/PDZ domain/PA domain
MIAMASVFPDAAAVRGFDGPTDPIVHNASQARLLTDLKYLSSDELHGRSADTPGLKMAADYIAARWAALGLKTDLFDGKPFQDFSLGGTPGVADPDRNSLSITKSTGEKVTLSLGAQFQPQWIGKNGAFDAELVFAGYGITASDENLKYDDFSDLNVQGKVVIVLRKEPQQADPKSPFDGTAPSQYALFTAKQINAAKHGVAALILVNDSSTDRTNPDAVLPVIGAGTAITKEQVPTYFVQRKIVEGWLSDAGRSLSEIEKLIDDELKPRSFELKGWKASGEVDLELKKLPSMNVVGLLPGKGELANEYVVIGAHFDHVGMGGPGSLAPGTIAVHNGADDNASGTIAIMEIANKLVELAKAAPPEVQRRSLIFIAFSGEERGLIGSDYYVKHPRFELENTVAMLNLDMVGRLTNNELTIYGTGSATEFDDMITRTNESLAFSIQRSPEGMGPSDHQSFFQKNIPVLHFFTGLHDDYHRPSDDFDKINLIGIDRITDIVTRLANQITVDPRKPTFVKVKGVANPRAPRSGESRSSGTRRIRLGVRLNLDGEGVIVERVMPTGPAKKAGIEQGDTLLKIDNEEITGRAELDRILQKHKVGDRVTVLVQRGSKKIELKVELTD